MLVSIGEYKVVTENPTIPIHLDKYVDWSQCPPVFKMSEIPDQETYEEILKYVDKNQ